MQRTYDANCRSRSKRRRNIRLQSSSISRRRPPHTPFFRECRDRRERYCRRRLSAVALLLSTMAAFTLGNPVVMELVKSGNLQALRAHLQSNPSHVSAVCERGQAPLSLCEVIRSGQSLLDVVKVLVELGGVGIVTQAGVNDLFPVQVACAAVSSPQSVKVVKYLLEVGGLEHATTLAPPPLDMIPVSQQAKWKDIAVFMEALQGNANIMELAMAGDAGAIRVQLAQKPLDAIFQDENGYSELHAACMAGQVEAATTIVQVGGKD
jgi:hypothetical protein